MNTYTLYWLDGKRETVRGTDPANAMMRRGYGGGTIRALDFYAKGDDHDFEWHAARREWIQKTMTKGI